MSDAHNTRTVTHTLVHLSGAGEWHPSFMEDMRSYARFTKDVYGCQWSDTTATHTKENPSKRIQDRQTDRQKHTNTHIHTHTHLADRSATYWAHLGGFHNLRGTVATHAPVRTRHKQMWQHVGSPLVRVKWASRRTSRLQNTLVDASP